jgi:hypothetical protein|tara:strand:- start:10834 stop:11610 length:777 start_codon:yes stop_codon:yes gene_type:complete
MFITTKSVFIWNGEKYVETHTEGYEYEGELSLAYGQDDLYSREDQSGQSPFPSTNSAPSLQDLTSKDIASIMADMGYDPKDIKDYAGYIPEFDPWKSEYASEEKGIGLSKINIEKQEIGDQRKLTEDLFGLGQESLQKQMFGTAQAGEQSLYQSYQQGSDIESAGLGKRSGITDRSKSSAMSQYGGQMESLALQGLEQETKYKASLDQLSHQLSSLGLEEQMIDVDYRKEVESEKRQYEDEFWEFMTFLKSEFDVGFG